jgi:hypothetical protein
MHCLILGAPGPNEMIGDDLYPTPVAPLRLACQLLVVKLLPSVALTIATLMPASATDGQQTALRIRYIDHNV